MVNKFCFKNNFKFRKINLFPKKRIFLILKGFPKSVTKFKKLKYEYILFINLYTYKSSFRI